MEFKTLLPRSASIVIACLLSGVPWTTLAYDITIDGLQIKFATDLSTFTDSSWADECGRLGLVPTKSYTSLSDIAPLINAVTDSGLTSKRLWAGRSTDGDGNTACSMAHEESITSTFSVVIESCTKTAHHLCKAPTPEIRLLEAPEASAGVKSFLCHVESTGSSITYIWHKDVASGASYLSSSSAEYPYGAAVSSTIGDYWCEVEISDTTSAKTPKYHLLDTDPAPSLQVGSHTVEAGGGNWLNCRTPSLKVDTYIWRRNGQIVESFNERSNFIFVFNFSHIDTGNYTCAISANGVESPESSEQMIQMIVPKPTLQVTRGILGGSSLLRCNTAYSEDVIREFTWYRIVSSTSEELTGHPISGSDLTIENISPDFVGEYTCTETISDVTSVKSTSKTLSYTVPQPTITAQNNYHDVIAGDNVTLICNTAYAAGSYARVYKWYKNSQELTIYLRYGGGDISVSDSRTTTEGFYWDNTGSDNNITIINFSSADALRYSCSETVVDVISTLSEQLVLSQSSFNTPTLQVSATQGFFGSNVRFVCDVGVDPPSSVSFKWFYTNDETNDIATRTEVTSENEFVIQSYQPIHVGSYSCAVFNGVSLLTVKSSWVGISFQVPQPTIRAHSQTVDLGGTLILTCNEGFGSLVTSDLFTSGSGMTIGRKYKWYLQSPGVLGTTTLGETTSKVYTVGDFAHTSVGNYACEQTIGATSSVQSIWTTIEFSVPQPILRLLPEQQSSVEFDSDVTVKCSSSYVNNSPHSVTRQYEIFSKVSPDAPESSMTTSPADVINSVDVLPFLACAETIEGVQSVKSDWLELNISVKTPTVHEMWDAETSQVVLTCQHQYLQSAYISYASFIWYDNDAAVSIGDAADLVLNGNTMTVHSIGQDRSGDFACSIAFFGISSNVSTQVISEETVNKPTIQSSSKQTVPSGSHVRLLCLWKESYTRRFLWKRNDKALAKTEKNERHIRKFSKSHNGEYKCAIRNGDGEWIDSDPILLETVDPFALCYCPCDNTTKKNNVTQEEVKEIVTSLKKNLTVEKSELSATIREKTSAPDERVASVSAGAVAIALITMCVLLIVIPDAISATIWLVTKIRYCSGSSASVDLVHH